MYSEENYNSITEPFFMQNPFDPNNIENLDFTPDLKEGLTKEKIDNLTNKYMVPEFHNNSAVPIFPETLKKYFIEKPYNREIYLKEWTIMSFKNIIERFETVLKDKIWVLDIGFRYMGLGYIKVIFYDPINKCYFFRYDGGSNGYDREANYNRLMNYKYDADINFGFTFEGLFEQIQQKKEEKNCILNI